MSRIFSRQEFYDLVWSKPMTHLAKEFALSDVALHKVCRKHDIPKPPVGWWAKKTAGRKVRQTALPKAREGISEKIVIAGAELLREPEALAKVRERARVLASAGAEKDTPTHPLVARTIALLRKRKAAPNGLIALNEPGLVKCEVAPTSVDRLEAILNAVVAACALQGFRLVADSGAAKFQSDIENVGFSVAETVRRIKHELSASEQAEEEKWHRKIARRHFANEWDTLFVPRPRFPDWDYLPTGQFSFELQNFYVPRGPSPRRAFRDAKIQRLENMADDIAVGLAVLAAAKTEQRLLREAQQQRRKEEEERRELLRRTRHVEERRDAALQEILRELEQVERLRQFVGNLQSQGAVDDGRLSEFLRWSVERLAAREAKLTAEGLETRFREGRLFGDDDDHDFSPSHQ
ncbi:hypothetical protein RCO27_14145 [Sphingosinicella sp. LHD-64]|uniref:hypothetical protein n=1 Tax=Sphingosinicella sp. LHD-64 TaxID=3072139 RepID=UPI00281045E9|nr:hypothetical protein [Sphingosinicella sp. LHD-64]MDQ8757367.1 hypothetical protein [Sphingosinicella sp. LHD-64]